MKKNSVKKMTKRAVLVRFESSEKKYAYATYDDSIKMGDVCLVGVYGDSDLGNELKVVEVVEISTDEWELKQAKKMILAKVDFSKYIAGRDYEKKFAELMAKAERRYAEMEKRTKWRIIAENDDEMRSILSEISALENGEFNTEISSENGTKGE